MSTLAENFHYLRHLPMFVPLTVAVPAIYLFFKAIMVGFGIWKGEATKRGMPLCDFFPYILTGCISCGYMSGAGLILYFRLFGVDDMYTSMVNDTMYSRSDFVENHIFVPMFVYQTYNLLYGLCWKETRDVAMGVHHVMAILVSLVAMHPFLQYDAFFFFSCSELTNLPLTWIDATKAKAGLKERFPIIHNFMMIAFVLLFLGIRVVAWPIRVIPCVYRIYIMIDSGEIHSPAVAWGFLFATAVLTSLQMVWGRKIFFLALRTFSGGEKKEKKKGGGGGEEKEKTE